MGTLRFLPLIVATLLLFPLSLALTTTDEAVAIANPQLVAFEEQHPNDHVHIDIGINIKINNPRHLVAHKALHALKQALYSGPNNFTGNWVGPDVCAYNGVSCVPSPHNESESAVASLDMNAADVAGYLPKEIGLMSDLAVLHLNSNRFCGVIPEEIRNMTELYELDASNNRFVGPFPAAVLGVPKLSYLDIRFNDFDGPIPPELFLKPYDAIFLNNNRFTSGTWRPSAGRRRRLSSSPTTSSAAASPGASVRPPPRWTSSSSSTTASLAACLSRRGSSPTSRCST